MILQSQLRSRPAIIYAAAWVTCWIAALMFSSDIYFGTPYEFPDFADFAEMVTGLGIVLVPLAAMCALFAVWPLAILGALICEKIAPAGSYASWFAWLVIGAAIGAASMWFYSALLGLGFDLPLSISINGAFLGTICAAIVRWFLSRPEIDYAAP